MTIDATASVRERVHPPTGGSGGGIGRRLPLTVAITSRGGAVNSDGQAYVDFIVANTGKTDFILPISLHPGDFEPRDLKTAYNLKVMSLFLSLDTGRGAERFEKVLSGGARLYGNHTIPASLFKLAPGESVRIETLISLPPNTGLGSVGQYYVAHASIDDETTKLVAGQTVADSREIGSTRSEDYSLEFLKSVR
jgi:hypothetical protein